MTAGTLVVLLFAAGPASLSPQALWDAWPERRFVATAAPCLRHAELQERLRALAERHPGRLSLETVGRSVEGREIRLLALGSGPRRVLLWSQMHGNEPSATPALLDLAATLLGTDAPEHRLVLERLTLLVVPMLNPDGAERYARRNAQAIDVNRDALSLATPEGRLLKELRDRFEPELGFNLHDQERRKLVGETPIPATIALLAVAADPQGTLTPGRVRARRVASAIVRALAPLVPGGISRYDEDWSPRAFGDNLTKWGTPVVLIESGAVPPGRPFADLTRLNYVALLSVLHGLALDDLAGEDDALYDGLARNAEGGFVDVLLTGGRVLQPPGVEPYRADVGFDLLDDDTRTAGCAEPGPAGPSRVREVGDGRLLAAARRLDVTGRFLVPALGASVHGWAARAWLSSETLDAASRLGVARVRWHVPGAEREAALVLARQLSEPGRAAVEIVDVAAPAHALVLPGPPRTLSGPPTLASAIQALTRGPVPPGRPAERLAAVLGAARGAAPPLRPDTQASLLVLRAAADAPPDLESLLIESVLVDGREAGSR